MRQLLKEVCEGLSDLALFAALMSALLMMNGLFAALLNVN